MENEIIKCLMFGQAGIGKSTFLRSFPNCKKLPFDHESDDSVSPAQAGTKKERYLIEYMDNKFEPRRVEIDNCDISLETCLHDHTLLANHDLLTPVTLSCSSQFINIANFKIIILCFSMDDAGSFQLIKSKWEIDLKRNKSREHAFLLVGLNKTINGGQKDAQTTAAAASTNKSKKTKKVRTSSTTSNSSTSKLQKKFKHRERLHSELDAVTHKQQLKQYKAFAKQIDALSFIQIATESGGGSNPANKINSYERILSNLTKKHELMSLNHKLTASSTLRKKFNIVKSISTPIAFIKASKSTTRIREECLSVESLSNFHENTSFMVNNQEDSSTPQSPRPDEAKITPPPAEKQATNSDLSIRDKLSRLAFGIGTYLVTCGSAQSRKLASLKQFKHKNTIGSAVPAVKRNKSWLLLASDVSLNNMGAENDDVFS
jgi:hypothetical protein